MSKAATAEKPQASATVAVRNTQARVIVLAYNTTVEAVDGRRLHPREITITPGLNLVDRAELEKCAHKGELEELERATGYELEIFGGPHELGSHEAIRLAKETSSRKVLAAWRSVERRENVIAAIDEQLAKRQ